MRSTFGRRSPVFAFLFVVTVACGSRPSEPEGPKNGTPIEDPRAAALVGTGTVDAMVLDAPPSDAIARAYDVAWWEVELHVEGDVAGSTTGEVSPADGTRIAIVFWGHRDDGAPTVEGRFAIDITQWLGLEEEHDPVDIARLFSGSEARFSRGGPLDDDERGEVFRSVFAAVETGLASSPTTKALKPSLQSKGGASPSMTTCAGEAKSALRAALTAVTKKFNGCVSCAAATLFGETSTAAWKACGTCGGSIREASGVESLFDVLRCKKVLSVPEASEDTVVTRPTGTTDAGTCWAASADKVRGTYRITDSKGAVTCGDCPAGTIPTESVLGCAPKSSDPARPVDTTKAIVQVPSTAGTPATTRVVSKDACLLVEIASQGTINSEPVQPGPRRVLYKIGSRTWDTLPKNTQTSTDTVNLTTGIHSNSNEGVFEVTTEPKAARSNAPDNGATVEAAIARGGCSSDAVIGLSRQIVEELARCVEPGMLVKVTSGPGFDASNVPHPFLLKPAAEALAKAGAAAGGAKMRVNHMFRTVAQQYFISRVGPRAECGIKAWARPGFSNHETGIALDVSSGPTFRAALEGAGFRWLGDKDPPHFDYVGAGSVDMRGKDVLAFQRLWNRNHPEDVIGEDGKYGAETQSRLAKSPAAGFPIGPDAGCKALELAPTGDGSREALRYLNNVTTSEHFPGEGCTTGADASHTDVNACLQSGAVCEPFWCDLADLRDPTCSGSTVKPTVSEPSPPPTESPKCSELGKFQLTYYYIAIESDFDGMAAEPMYDKSGALLAMAPTKFVKAARMNGTGKTRDGRALNWVGKCPHSDYGCFRVLDPKFPNGVGKAGRNLDPYQSIAVDPSVIPLGTRVYAKELVGVALPDGTTHDGWLLADDTGGRILGQHIDFFVEGRAAYRALDTKLRITQVTLSPEKCGG
jgi:3D (Asp-Asp-Asp) domain-containing protein